MADSPFSAPNNGRIGMPAISPGMNKIAAPDNGGGKGSKDDAENTRLGRDRDQAETAKILDRARKRMDIAIKADDDNRQKGLADDKFYSGDQWPADVQAQRNFDGRPCLTINQLPTLVRQVTNDQRMNRPGINISPVGDKGDPEVAKMYAGLVRYIERDSVADIAYDTAFESAARKGWGYWRVNTKYVSPDSFEQTIVIERIRNAYMVYLDPTHQNPDGSDAKWGFITEMIPRDEFKEQWPDADPMPYVQGGRGEGYKNWINQDTIRIAEYFEIENEKRTLIRLNNGAQGWEDEIPQSMRDMVGVAAKRDSFVPKVRWYKLTAVEILEETPWLGEWIPIVKLIGDEIDIEGKVILSGMVRHAKGPQEMVNYWNTAATEMVALAPKAPYIGAEGQFEGHEDQWKNANRRQYPYLEYKPTDLNGRPLPPPARQPPVPVPAGVVELRNNAAQDLMTTTGVRFNMSGKDHVYDESGRALRELRRFGDITNFHLVDNLAHSLRFTGDIIVNLIPKVFRTKQVLTILREDGGEERVEIDPAAERPLGRRQDQNGAVLKIFNPTIGKYGVTVTTGPSYATKRVEAAESMMDFVRALPMFGEAVGDLVAKNQDWPDAPEFTRRLAAVVAQKYPGSMMPDTKDLQPQVVAFIQGLQQQLEALQQEKVAMLKVLTDQQADRAQRQDKIELDFESKILQIMQKADAAQMNHLGSQLKDIAQAVQMLTHRLDNPGGVMQ